MIKSGIKGFDYSRHFNTFTVAEFQAGVYEAILKLM